MVLQSATGVGWETIEPQVSAEAEFREIVQDFGNPLELIREAISNAIDAHATWIKIAFTVEEVDGNSRLVISLLDNGSGMTREVIGRDFWGLGYSPSRERKDAIGEKGHGTKIYLRSESVTVRTESTEGAYLSVCERPMSALSKKQLHQPRIKRIDKFLGHTGTEITIVGYNDNQRSTFIESIVKDYILWFTKVGSIERMFGVNDLVDFKVYLQCLDQTDFEEIPFGHPFPTENSDINKLFDAKGASAADWYVKRYVWSTERLDNHPEVIFDAVISVEGDAVKRSYNPMIGERPRVGSGRYRVADRYGVWLCKDYIPIKRVNEWIQGFGSGSNAFVLLHGFVNCQSLKLTANRGDIANNPAILEELKTAVQGLLSKVDKELNKKEIYTLKGWQEESRTLEQEKTEFDRRVKNLRSRRVAKLDGTALIEPGTESELFGLFMTVYALRPGIFDFEPLDYNTIRGIDVIARHKSANGITEGEHAYIELKYLLQHTKRFNHIFNYLRWIVCWDLDKEVGPGTAFEGVGDSDIWTLQTRSDGNGHVLYFLDPQKKARKVEVICLKRFLKEKLNLEFEMQRS